MKPANFACANDLTRATLSLAWCTVMSLLIGCQSLAESTPREYHDDAAWNYQRVFRRPIPSDVTVVNSVVVTYAPRIGVVTTDDYEFELLAPPARIPEFQERFYLRRFAPTAGIFDRELEWRKEQAMAWYAPKPVEQYETYRDSTSAGYAHMLIDRAVEPDGRRRIFISKH